MTNLTQRDQKLQKLVNDTINARERRDDALAKLVKAQTALRTLELKQERFRKSTKAIRKRLLKEGAAKQPVAATATVTTPEPTPPPEKAAPEKGTAAAAAVLRAELRGDRKKR